MRRIWFALLGAAFGVVGVAFLTAFRTDALGDPASAATLALWFGRFSTSSAVSTPRSARSSGTNSSDSVTSVWGFRWSSGPRSG